MVTKQSRQNQQKPNISYQDIFAGLIVEGVKALLIMLGTILIGSAIFRQWLIQSWPIAIIATTSIALAIILGKGKTILRWKELKIYKNFSATKRNNEFIELAKYLYRRPRLANHALDELQEIAYMRRHPNIAIVQQIEQIITNKNALKDFDRKNILRYLENIHPAKQIIRTQVLQNMASFLRDVDQRTFIVLYGYSSTVCESIIAVHQRLPAPIIIVEDLQYPGTEIREHEKVRQHLANGGIEAEIIKFEDTIKLCSPSATFISHLHGGGMTPLPEKRRMLAIIGCEAVDLYGNVLIPSRREGKSSETAFFKEIFTKKEADDTIVTRQIVVVVESNKILETISDDDLNLGSPISPNIFQEALFLFGYKKSLPHTRNQLVKMSSSELYAIVDDSGIHFPQKGTIDLYSSFHKWKKLTNQSLPSFLNNNAGRILREVETVIFDMNGVLVNDELEHYGAFVHAVREQGGNLIYQEYLQMCSGLSDEEGAINLIREKNLNTSQDDFLAIKQERYSRQVADALPIFQRTVELVEKLSLTGKKIFLVTAASRNEVQRFLETNTFLKEIFDDDHTFSDVKSNDRKAIFRKIIKNLTNPRNCVVIDDSPKNIKMAKELDIKTIGIASTYPVESFDADVTSPSPDDLVTLYESASIGFDNRASTPTLIILF